LRRTFAGAPPTDEELAAARDITEFDRTLAAFDHSEVVATAGIFSYDITVPGGSLPCGGVTRVTVQPTHRRRGILTAMMRRQLDDMHQRGEPLAALYASEAPIYGRFGYGLATYQAELELERHRAAFRKPPSGGRVALIDLARAVSAFQRVWDDARPAQPGMLSLSQSWWRYDLADLQFNRHGASPEYRVIYEQDGKPTGFALYRMKLDWDPAGPAGSLMLRLLIASTAQAYAALWHYLANVDLVVKISAHQRSTEEPLRFLLVDSRQPKTRIEDGLWLRLVDVGKALAGRTYATEGRLVLRVKDDFCPWNDGAYELEGGPQSASCRPTEKTAELEITAADLAAIYLGGNRLQVLRDAGRVTELRDGSVARADAMFATDRAPWCPSHF
jgi:predicted acetyltransferase